MKEKILLPLRRFPCFVLFMYLLGLICLMIVHQGGRHVSVFELLVDVYVLTLFLSLLPKKIALWTKRVFYVIAYSLALVDMFCYCRLGAPISAALLRICLETNQREATEALSSYLTLSAISFPVILILLLMVSHIYVSWRKVNIRISTFGWAGICVLMFSAIDCAKNKVFIIRNLTEPKTSLEYEYASEIAHSGGFYLPFYRLLYAWKGVSLERGTYRKLERQTENVSIDSCTFRSPDIVLIIGEAYSKHHCQLYGYGKATTPRQMQMKQDGSLVAFTDVVSPFHQTSMVFRLAFSLYAYGQQGDWMDYPLFPQLFRKAGYQVTFLTNQFVPSPTLDIFDFCGSAFVNAPKLSESMFNHRNQHSHTYDLGLLEEYDSLSAYRQEHNLTIFHLLGQHTGYADRHPESLNRFQPSDYHRPELSDDDLYELAHYDNACLYNDQVVTEIVNRYQDKEAIIIYMPDHGEMCFDGSLTFGRTLSVNTPNEVYQQFEIPFWIWTSPDFRKNHPDIVKQVIKAKDRPFMTDDIPQLLLYLAGISTPFYLEEANIISPNYHCTRKRMLMGTIDYDKIIKTMKQIEK